MNLILHDESISEHVTQNEKASTVFRDSVKSWHTDEVAIYSEAMQCTCRRANSQESIAKTTCRDCLQ